MMVLVTGSRTWDDRAFIWARLDEALAERGLMLLVHGACPTGADAHADAWAKRRIGEGQNILVDRFPANWNVGRAAGMLRNADMVEALTATAPENRRVLAFIRDESKGASHCVKLARRAGHDVTVYCWEDRVTA